MDIVYTNPGKWVLSKKSVSPAVWKHKLLNYHSSHTFKTPEELSTFLVQQHHLLPTTKQFTISTIRNSASTFFEFKVTREKELMIKGINLDVLGGKGQLIDWEDWSYCFTKENETDFHLWVYLGGIAEQVREIKLSATQLSNWEKKGISLVSKMAAELKQSNSKLYAAAIRENRKVL